ncbi:carboxymuconolactone decarboxylase family protein [Mucilaginibacter hurinus]|uniref:Carboxymuconolactone decarboxylase family protein n=1 Tax=Mucilaginibacter hurinus TaxID=2201324 RepID=A0A367GSW9_9SPHI|nr:carboxymuconolactone decarboxylase family protein [Mucilaginibacter hurinus]RCH55793.1 carboxymuconolactone decarboxylase family protein [Mucilaginibacter hurinus]
MSNRTDISKANPAAYNAMLQLSNYVAGTPLLHTHHHLIKIRASQINGCAFCIDMHTRDARKAGETEQRIYALSAWRDTPFFDEQERAVLALTEEVTLIHGRVSDQTYQQASAIFDDVYITNIIMAIVAINGWNRIVISTEKQPALR